MKRLLIIGMALWAAVHLSAGIRTAADALRIAEDFMETSAPRIPRAPGQSPITNHQSQIVAESDLYLAVNTAPGYVIVGADERLPEVLGYSDQGAFDPENMAPALRFWLQCYEEELDQISNQKSKISNLKSQIAAIQPLCSSRWNQGDPYNTYAPYYNDQSVRCVTCCVATAMAQIMYFHKHPAQGTGSHSYLWVCTDPVGKSATLSANFGQTTYRWDRMLDTYKSGYTNEQMEAVATLMYHCGVSINMGYGRSSGAYTDKVPVALKDYFSYDANYQRIQKVMYPADSLNAIVHAELAANRPVLISGHNDEGGHAFVCDGNDNKGYFHINWGWGGSNDGYFLLTALNPRGAQGIGGTTQGYNKGTTFFIGLQPAKSGTPKAVPQMAGEKMSVDKSSFSRSSSSFSASVERLENFGMTDFSGSYGVALYDEDETRLVSILKQQDNYSLKAGYHRTTLATLDGLKIPSSVPAGTYHVCFVYKDANYGWMRLLMTSDDYYRTLILTNTTATFMANDAEPVMALTAPIAFPEGTDLNKVPKSGCPLSFSVKNTGGTFRGDISARIYKGAFAKGQYEILDSTVIRYNQTLNSALQQTFDKNLLLETQYKMKLCWRANANDSWHDFTPAEYAVLSFMLDDPDYHLSLPDSIRFDNNDSVPRSHANLYYKIKNTGAPFDGELQVSFYQTYYSRGKSSIQTVHIGTNETLEGAFSGPLEQVAGTYDVILRYREPDGEWSDFTDINGYNKGAIVATVYDDTATGLEPLTANPSPLTGKFIQGGQLYILREGKVYNAQGIRVK